MFSHLFLSFLLFSIIVGSEAGSPGDLRDLVAGIVLSHPVHYSAVLLGRPNTEYADWVTREESWGGVCVRACVNVCQCLLLCFCFVCVRSQFDVSVTLEVAM